MKRLAHSLTILSALAVLPRCDDDAAAVGDDAAVGDAAPDVQLDAAPDPTGRFPEDLPPGWALIDFGNVATLDGESDDLVVDVPEGAVSLHVTMTSHPGVSVALLGAAGPDGTWVVTQEVAPGVDASGADAIAYGLGGLALSPNKSVALPRSVTALLPNTPRVALTPGRWTLRVGTFDPVMDEATRTWDPRPLSTFVRVGALVRTAPVPTSGTIDLVLSFDPSSGLTAARARDDADIRLSLDVLDAALAGVGLAVGEVAYRDVALTTSTVALRPPGCIPTDDVAKVFDEAPAPSSGVVHVVFLGRFTCKILGGALDLGEQLGALSIGVPGMPFATRTGILASTFAKSSFPADWAEVLAHEVGHYLGLWHTRETTGVVDNIADTPDDDEGAKGNLMYFNVTLSTATSITADQGAVVRSSPLVVPDP